MRTIIIIELQGEIEMDGHGGPGVMSNTDDFYTKVCGCGVVHLSFGATCINMTPAALLAVSDTLREVALTLRNRAAEPASAAQIAASLESNVIHGDFERKV